MGESTSLGPSLTLLYSLSCPHSSENFKVPLLDSPTSYEHQVALHPLSNHNQSVYGPYTHSKTTSVSSMSSLSSQADTVTTSLLNNNSASVNHPTIMRTRSKSKPDNIFIHPAQSNLARADAAAQQLGLSGDTDLVQGSTYLENGEGHWELGKGRDTARELLGSRKDTV